MGEGEFEIFLVTAPGLETALIEEAREKGFRTAGSILGGVTVTGGWPEVWRANLELRGAVRVLARVAEFRALHLAQLDKRARKVPWAQILRPDVPFRVEAACKLIHANQGHGAIKVLRGGEVQIGIPGTADLGGFLILTVLRGATSVRVPVPLHVEVKVKGGTEDPDQTMVRQGLLRKDICAILADDIDDAIAQIREYKTRMERLLA